MKQLCSAIHWQLFTYSLFDRLGYLERLWVNLIFKFGMFSGVQGKHDPSLYSRLCCTGCCTGWWHVKALHPWWCQRECNSLSRDVRLATFCVRCDPSSWKSERWCAWWVQWEAPAIVFFLQIVKLRSMVVGFTEANLQLAYFVFQVWMVCWQLCYLYSTLPVSDRVSGRDSSGFSRGCSDGKWSPEERRLCFSWAFHFAELSWGSSGLWRRVRLVVRPFGRVRNGGWFSQGLRRIKEYEERPGHLWATVASWFYGKSELIALGTTPGREFAVDLHAYELWRFMKYNEWKYSLLAPIEIH